VPPLYSPLAILPIIIAAQTIIPTSPMPTPATTQDVGEVVMPAVVIVVEAVVPVVEADVAVILVIVIWTLLIRGSPHGVVHATTHRLGRAGRGGIQKSSST
jgi:hypothetical protein